MNEGGHALGMLGIGKALKQPVGSAESWEGDLGPVDHGGEPFVMPLTGFAEKHGVNLAAGAKGFLNQADTFDADEAPFGGQTAAKSHAELLQPAIVAAAEERRVIRGTSGARDLSRGSHHRGG